MTSICRGLNVGEGKSWAAARMVVTLGTPELGDDTLGATPTLAGGAVGTPAMSMARCKASRTPVGVTRGDRPTPTDKGVVCPSRRSDKPRCRPASRLRCSRARSRASSFSNVN